MTNKHATRQIPWPRVIDFHAEITRRSEEAFFSLPITVDPVDRWCSLKEFEPAKIAGPWIIQADWLTSPALSKAIESGQTTDLFMGTAAYIGWKNVNGDWRPDWRPVLYREVSASWLDGGKIKLTPGQGNWDLSPLLFNLLERRQVQLATPIEELLPGLLEQSQGIADSGEKDLSAAVKWALSTVAAEIANEFQNADAKFPEDRFTRPSDWVLFTAPSQVAATHQHIRRDYELLQKRMSEKSSEIGGLALLEDPPGPPSGAAPKVLPIVPLNESQRNAVIGILGHRPVTVVSGPPGCGKSQVVLSVLLNAWAEGQSVLFASNNNQAVDVIRERLERFESDFPIAIRAGSRKFNNIEESLRRTLNVITGAGNGVDIDESAIDRDRKRLQLEKQEVQQLIESQLPQQVFEASTAAIKAYRQYHERKNEHESREEQLLESLNELGYQTGPNEFADAVLGPLDAWLNELQSTQNQVARDEAARTSQHEAERTWRGRRNRALNTLGYMPDEGQQLDWLIDGPGPELLIAWKERVEQLLAEPIEETLSQIHWIETFDQWSNAADAKDFAVRTDQLSKDVSQAAADLLPVLTDLQQARQKLDAEEQALTKVMGEERPTVVPDSLNRWSALYAELCSLLPGRMDALPWSSRSRVRRNLKKIEKELRPGFPLSVWRKIGVMDDAGRSEFAEVAEPVQRWISAQTRWDELASSRQELESRLGSFRARAAELALNDIPAKNDLEAWNHFSKAAKTKVPEAIKAMQAHEARSRQHKSRAILKKIAQDFRTTASGVPIKEAWTAGLGQPFLATVNHLDADNVVAKNVTSFRQALYDDALSRLLRLWAEARNAQEKMVDAKRQADQILTVGEHSGEWLAKKPEQLASLEFDTATLPGSDHAVWQHRDAGVSWDSDWQEHINDIQGAGKEQLEQDANFALDRLNDAFQLAPKQFSDRLAEVIVPLLDQRSLDWPIGDISQAYSFFVPEQLKARVSQLEKELEKLSFDLAKRDWMKRVSGDSELQDCLDRLLSHYRRYKTRIRPEAFSDFEKALGIQPIWITAAMSAQSIPMSPDLFDILVIDEATQCTLTNMLPLIFRAKNLVVIGDPEQLTAIHDIGTPGEMSLASKFDVEDWLEFLGHNDNDIYKTAVKCLPRRREDVIPLLEHYRSHPLIIGFSNKHIYQTRLKLQKKSSEVGRVQRGVFGVNVSGTSERGPRNQSWINQSEAAAICDLVAQLREQSRSLSIGVVTPFRPQKELITDLLQKRGILKGIVVDTVHRFQGDERDVMVFGPVVAEGMSEGAARWVESPPNLINVAATRAREAFFFVGDFEACRAQQGILSDLTKYVEIVEELRETSEAELKLFTEMVTFGLDPEVHVAIGDIEVDFVLEQQARRLVIEVDGSQHEKAKTQDAGRDAFLIGLGYEVVRVTARQVLETPALVIKEILEHLGQELDEISGILPVVDTELETPEKNE